MLVLENIVELDGVSKKYVGQQALNNASLALPGGKIVGLVGPNGSGKSTMLKIMAGLVHPGGGSVKVNGKKVTRRSAAEVAYMSELDILYPFYTVEETLLFNAGLFPDFDLAKAREMLVSMQLEPGKKVKALSKGNRGRLKIVLVLARDVPLVLMDEPLSGLDPMVRDAIIKSLISYLNLARQTVIMSTHEVAEVEPILDTVVAMRNGRICGMAEVEDIRGVHGLSLVEWMKRGIG